MPIIRSEYDIKRLIREDSWMMEVLSVARSLDLPDWMIGAGYVRNKIWDHLHGYTEKTKSDSSDIDLAYFNPAHKDKAQEKQYEKILREMMDENWSVKNQARMSEMYTSCEDAISCWPETCTCIAVKLDADGELRLIAPAGIIDLINLVVRRGLRFDDEGQYRRRIEEKEWKRKWPRLKIL